MSKFVIFSIKLCNRSRKHNAKTVAVDGSTKVVAEEEHASTTPIIIVAPAIEPGARGIDKVRVITIPACSFA